MRGEIIVSGGVFGSPQLLQLSGIGPADLLAEIGIPVVREMPAVGANLHDHFNTYLVWRCTQPVTMNDMAMQPAAQAPGGDAICDVPLRPAVERRDLCRRLGAHRPAPRTARSADQFVGVELRSSGCAPAIKPHPFSAFTLSAVHLRPDGRGTVRLKSPDPLAPPAIQFNFLASDADFQALISGMRLAARSPRSRRCGRSWSRRYCPGPEVETEAEMKEEIRVRGVSNLHPVGTCRMGRGLDAVVDPRLRVHGVERLRVADASIMPQVPGGNTNAPSIMIGEKCAAMVLEDALAA